jgi:hypothetical protein
MREETKGLFTFCVSAASVLVAVHKDEEKKLRALTSSGSSTSSITTTPYLEQAYMSLGFLQKPIHSLE